MIRRNILINTKQLNWTGVLSLPGPSHLSWEKNYHLEEISFLWLWPPGRASPSPSPLVSPWGNLEHKDYLHQPVSQPASQQEEDGDASFWLLPCCYHCPTKLVVLLLESFVATDSKQSFNTKPVCHRANIFIVAIPEKLFIDFQFSIGTLPSFWPC